MDHGGIDLGLSAYTLSLASHIVKLRKVVEVVKTVDAQHKPSSFSTSVFSP